jgi:hypothetical protein
MSQQKCSGIAGVQETQILEGFGSKLLVLQENPDIETTQFRLMHKDLLNWLNLFCHDNWTGHQRSGDPEKQGVVTLTAGPQGEDVAENCRPEPVLIASADDPFSNQSSEFRFRVLVAFLLLGVM